MASPAPRPSILLVEDDEVFATVRVMKPLLGDAAAGADTIVWLAGSRSLDRQTSGFWHDRRRRPQHRLDRTKETPTECERFFAECEALAKVEIKVKET